jgi:hypothetical protein
MTASRNEQHHRRCVEHGLPTAAVVRRKRRPPPWTSLHLHLTNRIAFGAALPTPAMLAGVDNAQPFSVIVDG